MQAFELIGHDGDETRLLRSPSCGYSIALAGRPRIAPSPAGRARYDVVVALDDLQVQHGFRIDELPAHLSPQELAIAMATAYRNRRAIATNGSVLPLPFKPAWLAGGAEATYQRRDETEPTMEQVCVLLRASPSGLWGLFHTTWFKTAEVDNLRWAHVRASFMDQHAWDGKPRDTAPTIWPPSAITLPSARLELTEHAWKVAAGKAADVGSLSQDQVRAVVTFLRQLSQSDLPPRAPVPEMLRDNIRARLMAVVPGQSAAILASNLDECRTRHDLRGWARQCIWAVGNRAELG